MVQKRIIRKIVNQKADQDLEVKNLQEVILLLLKVLKVLILYIKEVIKVLINIKKIAIVKIKREIHRVKI